MLHYEQNKAENDVRKKTVSCGPDKQNSELKDTKMLLGAKLNSDLCE